ncbi:hypothetical protein LH51_13295 [Nitrincola sp. A-D6]|uniref:hypothetical protein n=1 Tax=Nitrincola sp. A-D6 TaxID=1545442 RepID=UPI00051FE1A6|nr:hypothetical protein [Nitrincola sp. A-D6]KGK41658.1 hypothetical protein LH51_13295 [Nitrincola sp. A-D6]
MSKAYKVQLKYNRASDEKLKYQLKIEAGSKDLALSLAKERLKEIAISGIDNDVVFDQVQVKELSTVEHVTGETREQVKRVYLVKDFNALSEAARDALGEFIEAVEVLEIVTAHNHGMTETSISYLRDGKVYEVLYDETTGKLLGGSEPAVFEKVIAVLPESGRQAVADRIKTSQQIRKIQIKHDDKDDREYLHLHTIDPENNISDVKLELDGSCKH